MHIFFCCISNHEKLWTYPVLQSVKTVHYINGDLNHQGLKLSRSRCNVVSIHQTRSDPQINKHHKDHAKSSDVLPILPWEWSSLKSRMWIIWISRKRSTIQDWEWMKKFGDYQILCHSGTNQEKVFTGHTVQPKTWILIFVSSDDISLPWL